MSGQDLYVRFCPVCGAEHPPAVAQCPCGTLLAGVDLSLKAVAAELSSSPAVAAVAATAPAEPATAAARSASAPAAAAGRTCAHADCAAMNPPGVERCLYCDRPFAVAATEATRPDPTFAPAADSGVFRLPAALRERFRIVRVLPAAGAEAEIMVLEGAKSGVQVVAKLYRPGILPKFEVLDRVREVAYAHVIHIISHGVSDGVAFELMEYCGEGSLRELLRAGPLPVPVLRTVVAELAEALAAVHGCHVIHRDLKPENVLIRRRQPLDLVLTDFGIASVNEATQLFTGLARTVKYGAPETLSGVLDEAADWWSLGMIVAEALLGAHPFAGLSEPVVTHRLATATMDLSALTDPTWRKLCRGLLLRDPKRRWGIAEVRRWLAGDATLVEPRDERPAQAAEPYLLESSECRDRAGLAAALARHWPAGRKDLSRGHLNAWVRDQLKDQNLLRFIHDLLDERGADEDLRLFRLISHLAPDQPPVWRGEALTVGQLLAMAARAEGGETTAADWLASVFDTGVLDLLRPAPAELADLGARWQAASAEFLALWRRVAEARQEARRQAQQSDGFANFDALVFGRAEEMKPPPAGRLHAALLLALAADGYADQLAERVGAALAVHVGRCPWLRIITGAPLVPVAAVAGSFLVPVAEAAAQEAQVRAHREDEAQVERVAGLATRVNMALVELRAAAEPGLLSGVVERQALHTALEGFLALSAEVRGLGLDPATPLVRTVARTEPIVFRLQAQADQWEHAARLNEVWQNRNLLNAAGAVFFFTLMFAPAWLPYVLALPLAALAWRLWRGMQIRSDIAALGRSLPLRVVVIQGA